MQLPRPLNTSLRDKGYRFVKREGEFRWVHPLDVEFTDVDCTDLNDEEFEAIVRESGVCHG